MAVAILTMSATLRVSAINLHFAGVDLGEVKKTVDEFEQMFRADQNFLQIFFLQIRNLVFRFCAERYG